MSVAPVTNERFYDTIYSERYMGLPNDNVKGYRDCSAITWAHQLKGNLLLVHGTADDNVHYANSEALVNELIRHNKQFTMMAYPNRSHSISEGKNTRQHLFTLMTNYLHRNLPPGPATEKVKDKAVGVALVEEGDGPKDKVKELQKKRVAKLTELHRLIQNEARIKLFDPFRLFEVTEMLYKARLELCETKQDRINVLEEFVKESSKAVELLRERAQQGLAGSEVGLLIAEASLLEAQVALEKAKQEK
jgi:hypothetical protein